MMRTETSRSGLALLVRPGREEAALWRRLRFEEDEECRRLLFERYVGLARSVAARHYLRRAVKRADRGDYEQFAFEGLLQAIDRYDPVRGVPFSAFARRRILGSIVDGVARMSEIGAQIGHRTRIEQERLRSLARRDKDAKEEEDAIGTLSDLAFGLALGLMLEGTSLVQTETSADARPTAYESLERREFQARLVQAVEALSGAEATVIRQHYDNGLSFAAVADLLGLSRGRISQLHRSALERLRKRLGGYR
jgi:RNA polymerase sigma factor for flagellar operon FliA